MVDETEHTKTNLDQSFLALVALIDEALTECANRSLIEADKMTNHLLDIRTAATGLNNE